MPGPNFLLSRRPSITARLSHCVANDQHFHFHGGSRPDLHTSPYVLRYDRFSISLRRNITEFVILVRRSENWSESRNWDRNRGRRRADSQLPTRHLPPRSG